MSNKTSTSLVRSKLQRELSAPSKPVASNSQQEVLLSPSLLVMQQPQTTQLTTVSRQQPTPSEKTQENQQEPSPTTPTTRTVLLSHKTNTSTGRNNQSLLSLRVLTKQQPVQPVNQPQQEKQMVQAVHVLRHSHIHQTILTRQQQNKQKSINGLSVSQVATPTSDLMS